MKVLAGDWPADTNVAFKTATFGKPTQLMFQRGLIHFDYYPLSEISGFEIVTEENRASVAGKVGWGVLGAVALGPIGLLAGAVLGGNRRDRLLSVVLADGKKALIKGNAKDAEILSAATFGR